MSKEDVAREPNLWEGIYYFPDAAPENKFMATIIEGRKTKTIGLFESLEKAVDARDRILASPRFPKAQRYEPRKESATYVDPNLETRTY